MEKEKFVIPYIEIIKIDIQDIICTSKDPYEHNPEEEDPGFDPFGPW